jgi:hypothetical protein
LSTPFLYFSGRASRHAKAPFESIAWRDEEAKSKAVASDFSIKAESIPHGFVELGEFRLLGEFACHLTNATA